MTGRFIENAYSVQATGLILLHVYNPIMEYTSFFGKNQFFYKKILSIL